MLGHGHDAHLIQFSTDLDPAGDPPQTAAGEDDETNPFSSCLDAKRLGVIALMVKPTCYPSRSCCRSRPDGSYLPLCSPLDKFGTVIR